jgi:putative membrane protein
MSGPTGTALDSTQMALDRTWLAHERTLMAWVRTATSMISFAFAQYKFFEFEQKQHPPGVFSPRAFAIFLSGVGLVALLFAVINREREVRELKTQLHQQRFSLATLVAALIFLFGLVVFISVTLRQ